MQTILVRYYGATNTKGACLRAWASGNPQKRWKFSSDTNTATQAAQAVATELDWPGHYVGGSVDNDTTVFVSDGLPAANPERFSVARRER